jgi:hypothetical protein
MPAGIDADVTDGDAGSLSAATTESPDLLYALGSGAVRAGRLPPAGAGQRVALVTLEESGVSSVK